MGCGATKPQQTKVQPIQTDQQTLNQQSTQNNNNNQTQDNINQKSEQIQENYKDINQQNNKEHINTLETHKSQKNLNEQKSTIPKPIKQIRTLVLGLDYSGKTTILYKLKLQDVLRTVPTIGFNVETLEYKDYQFEIWDIGGQDKIRELWKHYYQLTKCVIYVVDCSNSERMHLTKNILNSLFKNEELKDCVFLIYANKSDLSSEITQDNIIQQLELQQLNNIKWHVQLASAVKGQGLYEGLDWVIQQAPTLDLPVVSQELPEPNQQSNTQDKGEELYGKREYRLLILGLDNAGKTQLLYKLKDVDSVNVVPTIGFNVETLDIQNTMFTAWDIGGQPKLRQQWKHYWANTQGLIYVVDSSDSSRIHEAQKELENLLIQQELGGVPVLILANKSDISTTMNTQEITEKLNLNNIQSRTWHIQPCSAKTGEGLQQGLEFLQKTLTQSK